MFFCFFFEVEFCGLLNKHVEVYTKTACYRLLLLLFSIIYCLKTLDPTTRSDGKNFLCYIVRAHL